MKKFLLFLVVLLAIAAVVGFVAPTEFDLAREITISASPAEVHAYVGNLENWPKWTTWAQEPSVVTTLGAKTTGVGASQTWTSKDGDGELTFTDCDPATGIAYDMAFIMEDGTRSPAKGVMTYTPVDGGTQVTWTMEGDWGGIVPAPLAGLMQLMSGMMIGPDFEGGLANLKQAVESGA